MTNSKIHFIGIGGIGVSSVVRICLKNGWQVSGSDLVSSDITKTLEKFGAKIFIGEHKEENISKDIELVVYSNAVKKDNQEVLEAKKLNIITKSYAEFLGELTKDKFLIAVSGMHGKTTTTAMISLILTKAGLDPTVVVGSKLREFNNSNARVGKSKYWVIEADEYKKAFLNYNPKILVLTRVEAEHLDCYKDLDDIVNTFSEYIKKIPKDGLVVANGDDKNIRKIIMQASCPVLSYGRLRDRDIKIYGISSKDFKTFFKIKYKNKDLGEFVLQIPGEHNVYNAVAAIGVALNLDIKLEDIKKALFDFKGTWRRFETKGEINGIIVIDDYGHHPTEIKATLKAAKEFYPKKRIWCIFQPHQLARTKFLFKDFTESFYNTDKLIITDIYVVAGREKPEDFDNVNSKQLVDEIKKKGIDVQYIAKFEDIVDYISEEVKPGDVVITMGAGNITKVSDMIVKKLKIQSSKFKV